MEGNRSEEDDGLEITGAREAHQIVRGEPGMAPGLRPREGRWKFAGTRPGVVHAGGRIPLRPPSAPVPQGVPQALRLILRTIAPMGALLLGRSYRHEEQLRDVVEAAHGGAVPAVGYAVAHAGRNRGGSGAALQRGGLAHSVSGGPMEGYGVPP